MKRVKVRARDTWKFAVVCLIGSAILAVAITALVNTARIHSLANDLDARERADIQFSREADARNCSRHNRTRAEIHHYWRNSPADLARVERSLPIITCESNLRGVAPRARPIEDQRRFVCLYRTHQLAPLPEPQEIDGDERDSLHLCN